MKDEKKPTPEEVRATEDRAMKLLEGQPASVCLTLLHCLKFIYASELRAYGGDLTYARNAAMRKEAV